MKSRGDCDGDDSGNNSGSQIFGKFVYLSAVTNILDLADATWTM
jgi:hypothetical protein